MSDAARLKPGDRVREIAGAIIVNLNHERPARTGTITNVQGPFAEVKWDAGQDQTGAPDGPDSWLNSVVELDWLEPVEAGRV
ncbi:MAG TPA: hypothetical protein VGO53_16480 [Steroidobacteraceae bacterium]|nr:hypothetical protein [Steroidobacteraceae bacterium]